MKTLVAIAAFVAASINATAGNSNKPNITTSSINNCIVMSAEKVKTEFAIDEMGRATSKTVYNWNEANGAWTPAYQYSVCYGEKVNTIAFAKWDNDSRSFSKNFDSMCYDSAKYPTLLAVPQR